MLAPFTTYSGHTLDLMSIRKEDIALKDIAHHLSSINRFNGALQKPISVAQHSVTVSRLLKPYGYGALGLLHDASEAYLGDVTKWLKQTPQMTQFRELEDKLSDLIYEVFNIRPDEAALEKLEWADRLAVRHEAFLFLPKSAMFNNPKYPLPTTEEARLLWESNCCFVSNTWEQAKADFLMTAMELNLV